MNGQRTAIVLGAGASYCYEDGRANVPTQVNILQRLFFGASTTSGEGFPSFVGPDGLQHDFELAQFLRARFGMPEDPTKEMAKLDFWPALQDQGLTLESLYAILEAELRRERAHLLRRFEAIVRTAVRSPVADRGPETVCRYHRMLVEALEPGDYIISFNWDTLMADALLYHSHMWFPATGFGMRCAVLLPDGQKSLPLSSDVHLLHVHGSLLLFAPHEGFRGGGVYLGPQQYNEITALAALSGIDTRNPPSERTQTRTPSEAEHELAALGHMYLKGRWFEPIFVTPSHDKALGKSKYLQLIRSIVHGWLPTTSRIVVLGYSFPPADTEHLRRLFPLDVLAPDLQVRIVNPSNADAGFRDHVTALFQTVRVEFAESDFRSYARANASPWHRFIQPAVFSGNE